jgi:transposase
MLICLLMTFQSGIATKLGQPCSKDLLIASLNMINRGITEHVRPDPDILQHWVIREGVPAAQVGTRLGLSRAAGYAWLRRYGITSTGPPVSQESLVARWRAGQGADHLAADLGLDPDALRERLVAAAVLRPRRSYFVIGAPDDPLPESLLRDWYVREGFTVAQVAALTGTTPRQVRYRLVHYRLSPGRPGPASRVRRRLTKAALVELYQREGLTCPQIAARARVSPETVRELLAEYGIARRPSGTRARPPISTAAVRDYRHGKTTLGELAMRLGYVTPSGNPAVRRLRSAMAEADLTEHAADSPGG